MCVDQLLSQTITLKRKTNTVNAIGEQVPTWATNTTLKGCIRVMTASEQFRREKLPLNVTHVMFFKSTAPNADDRVYYGSETYLIKSIERKDSGYPGEIKFIKAWLERVEVDK